MWKWKKKEQKIEQKKAEKKEENLLKELCGDDAKLCDLLSSLLYINPLTAISKKDLDILTEEAGKSGNFGPAVDKAIFEATQNPGERERYIKVIQNLLPKTIHAMEQQKEKAEKEGLTSHAAYLGSRIENQKFISERAEVIINIASKYYNEKLVIQGEDARRKARGEEKREAKREEERIEKLEEAEREARKEQRRGMGGEEKREAKKQDERKELAAEERKQERGEIIIEAEREEERIGEMEEVEREARKEERKEERSGN
ncbi:hypothetical protein ACFLVP_03380 [Chloroflexota bacterium]